MKRAPFVVPTLKRKRSPRALAISIAFHILAFFTSTGGLITGFFGKSGFRVAGIVMNAIVLFIVVTLFAIGIVLILTVGLSGMAGEGFGDPGYQENPWEDSYGPDFESDF